MLQEYAKGAYLPVLLEAPVNGILSPSVATAKNAFGGGGINTTTNPVASHGNGVSSTKVTLRAGTEGTLSHLWLELPCQASPC